MKKLISLLLLTILTVCSASASSTPVKKILFFGDSMTGWMAERLQAYGEKNGYEVATIIWDGATIKKYGNNSSALAKHIKSTNPDAIFISLGMNEMAATNPAKQLSGSLSKLTSTIGDIPIIWIGPCNWPGKPKWGPDLDKWLSGELGQDHYYSSLDLSLPRQSKTNPHPTRAGINKWMDEVMKWLESNKSVITLPGYAKPSKEYARPKTYIYRKMNNSL